MNSCSNSKTTIITDKDVTMPHAPSLPMHVSLPEERRSITHKIQIGDFESYLTVGFYDDGTPGEIFITAEKQGSQIRGILNAFSISVSAGLQHGIPLDYYIKKFKHMKFEPDGFTGNPEINFAASIMDYIFRWLEAKCTNVNTRVSKSTEPQLSFNAVPDEARVEEERSGSTEGESNRSDTSATKSTKRPSSENQYSVNHAAAAGQR